MTHNNMPREVGTRFEVVCVTRAQERGLPWDRAPLRGTADLLDMQGCQPAGFLVGCKAITRPAHPDGKLGPAMKEARAAANRWEKMTGSPIIPVQIIQRATQRSQPRNPGQAYAVMEYDDFLTLVLELQALRAKVAA